jgi:hypothetical protein
MKKSFSVLGLAAAVLIVALALTSGYADKALGGSTCPSGTQKFMRMCIDKSVRAGNKTFYDASATCAALGRRLPTGAELDSFRQQSGVNISTTVYEWTGDILSSSTSLAMLDDGRYSVLSHSLFLPFRCVR